MRKDNKNIEVLEFIKLHFGKNKAILRCSYFHLAT